MRKNLLVINPKRVNEDVEEKPYWYNYYAGYSHSFAKKIIDSSDLSESSIILDPWNGAGTTTLMSSVGGYKSIGVDLNPVMKIISTAKQATLENVECVERKLLQLSEYKLRVNLEDDSLRYWFRDSGILVIRKIESWILDGKHYRSMAEKVNSLSVSQCVLYTALFNCVREYLKEFVPSNPTWIKKPKSDSEKVHIEWTIFNERYTHLVSEMLKGLKLEEHVWPADRASLMIASSINLPLSDNFVDLVLSSPPYCTRIDYGVATLPELAIIAGSNLDEMDNVRRALMGTTTISKDILFQDISKLTKKCANFLDDVKSHSSKASATYYYKNMLKYFLDLNKSLGEIFRVMKEGASFVCVVQDSFYKDVHCDLPSILVEFALNSGLSLERKVDFESKQNMANLNVKSRSYRAQTIAYESVLIFTK